MRIVRRAVVLAPALLTAALVAAPSAEARTTTVTVQDFGFSPASVTVAQGGTVTWQFNDSVDHTSTSDQRFWNSSPKGAGEKYVLTLTSAGTFGYHCRIHPDMTGRIRVPLRASGHANTGYTVRWSSLHTAPAGRGYDVQYRRSTSTTWKTLRSDTRSVSLHFNPSRDGTYVLRARTRNDTRHASSGWSPTRSVKIT